MGSSMTAKVTASSNYGRAIIVIGMPAHRKTLSLYLFLFLSLSRFITRTIGTIDPMITAENIIVNAYDPLMTMDHSRCQIGRGSNGADRARARACNRHAKAREPPRIDTCGGDDERI